MCVFKNIHTSHTHIYIYINYTPLLYIRYICLSENEVPHAAKIKWFTRRFSLFGDRNQPHYWEKGVFSHQNHPMLRDEILINFHQFHIRSCEETSSQIQMFMRSNSNFPCTTFLSQSTVFVWELGTPYVKCGPRHHFHH